MKSYKSILVETSKELYAYQNEDKKLIKTRYPWLEGLKPGDIVLIGGPSFTGKTYLLNEIKADIMSTEYNPMAAGYVWLANSLEMTNLNNLIIDFSKLLHKSKKDILTQKFNDMEKSMVKSFVKYKADGRYFVNEESFTIDEFDTKIRGFIESHINAECIFIDIDHLRFLKGSNKKSAIDDFMELQNILKKEYSNLVFINLSQFNRDIIGRAEEKSERAKIQRSDFADSDVGFTVADFVVGINTPFAMGIDNYRLVSPSFYDYLMEHFGDFNAKGNKVSFKTHGRIFYEVQKSRFVDGFNAKNLFITQLELDPIDEVAKKEKPKFKEEVINLPFKD